MRRAVPEPERWTGRRSGGRAAEDRYSDALRTAAAAPLPGDEAFERIRDAVLCERPARPIWAGALVFTAAALATGGGAVWATRAVLRPQPQVSPPRSEQLEPARPRPHRRAAPHVVEPAAVAPADEQAPVAPAEAPAAPPVKTSLLPPPVKMAIAPPPVKIAPRAPAPTESPPLPTEAQVLSEAFRHLRAGDDPAGALAALDEHARRFPFGALQPEAALARAEALLRLGRRAEGLAVVEALQPEPGRERERAVVRGELRAAAGRWAPALADFDSVIARGIADESEERALRGRSACRAQLGDSAGARADLRLYLARHPQAPRAAEVRRALGGAN